MSIERQYDRLEMRKIYAETLKQQMLANPLVIELEADLMSSMGMDQVQKILPNQVINCGIMEANVVGMAAGLSLAGHIPFFHTFTAFASRRCFDQLFMSLDYQENNVKVIASDAGISAVHNGGTHMSFEDMGIVRGLAKATVLEITDGSMMQNIVRQLVDLKGFYWVRTIRKQAVKIYAEDEEFSIGKAKILRKGKDITLIANGIMVAEALTAAERLAQQGIAATVVDMFTLKPIDQACIIEQAQQTGRIVTCENHSIYNGLGSAVAEVLSEHCPVPLRRVGVKGRYGQVGTQDFLMQEYELSADHIVKQALSLLV
ncbi:transketolase family protein [Testudinibacter sp. TR-2022]|uniref:transketolase family protein n=1 Tax=Testudinibacter sp. TR-2022 TaxID=2585029 RepID=UPI001119D9F3|nr:transketolase family protein [Testudinibacter sp. TR-2022]TNH03870.1 transketolase family protein [Pasteurellaceae bacterium Phil31]TNH08677.1 transketolase family protein [Testudinibacter sp. TR-2022]TNH08760.1 transketolase family protein [Testudinibacter sp. TR-2022]TNH14844.1 transketolase family protein [Testudinibacter sp. TR-2022]TNH18362.1 transketolase family protein [Testudinibacter sp. TR-2022]